MNSPETTLCSPEDQDTLERSTKKTKRLEISREDTTMDGVEMEMEPQEAVIQDVKGTREGNGVAAEKTKGTVSYRSMLTRLEDMEKKDKEEEDMASDDEHEDKEREGDKDCPVITLTKKEKARLRKQWRQSLIIKVMGKVVGYSYLLRRLNAIWHPKAKMDLITLANNYFLVKFGSVMDYEFAKYGDPWMIMDHYLIVKEWRPNFDPMMDKTEKVIVWVRLPDLPMEYYDHTFLFRVGKQIGEPMMIDSATSLTSRGKFARLCVEVDITKPLLAKFWLRRKVRRI